jgi:hypothetical protein
MDAAQLVKANSIEGKREAGYRLKARTHILSLATGNKKNNLTVSRGFPEHPFLVLTHSLVDHLHTME